MKILDENLQIMFSAKLLTSSLMLRHSACPASRSHMVTLIKKDRTKGLTLNELILKSLCRKRVLTPNVGRTGCFSQYFFTITFSLLLNKITSKPTNKRLNREKNWREKLHEWATSSKHYYILFCGVFFWAVSPLPLPLHPKS